jgi:hypothetical protein
MMAEVSMLPAERWPSSTAMADCTSASSTQLDDATGRDIDEDRRPMALDRRDGRLRLGHLLRERAPAVCGW